MRSHENEKNQKEHGAHDEHAEPPQAALEFGLLGPNHQALGDGPETWSAALWQQSGPFRFR